MNTPILETERLILREFAESDLEAFYEIYSDEEVNQFLPWFPLKSMEEAKAVYKKQIQERHGEYFSYHYAICLKDDNYPMGYVNVEVHDGNDLGYGLRKEFWHRGIVTEACKAVIEQLKRDGIPYITATHDINNPKSGSVMKRLGMKYRYSYEEQWQPKDILVTFRMYQLNFDEPEDWVYKKYWERSAVHFVETGV